MLHHIILTSLSALLLALCFPPYHLPWLSLISLLPLLYVLHCYRFSSSFRHRFTSSLLIGFTFGIVFMGISNLWVFSLIEFSTLLSISCLFILYTLFESLFFIALSCSYSLLRYRFFPCLWVIFEYIRSAGVFGTQNAVLGYCQASLPLLKDYAAIGGVFLVSFICVLINCLLFSLLCQLSRFLSSQSSFDFRTFIQSSGFSLALISGLFFLPLFFSFPSSQSQRFFHIGLVQGHHTQSDKLSSEHRPSIRHTLISLTRRLLLESSPQLILWPETITPSLNLRDSSFMIALKSLSSTYNTAILFGTPRKVDESYYNSAILLHDTSYTLYDKQLLMPFGEYWPFKSFFHFFGLSNIIPGSEFIQGPHRDILTVGSVRLGPAICLETTYPSHYRQFSQRSVDILVSLVNNAWFGTSSIAERQLQMLIFRAIENGKPIIQSANFGFSAIISNQGQVLYKTPALTSDAYSFSLSLESIRTPYIYFGDSIFVICFIFVFFGWFVDFFSLKNNARWRHYFTRPHTLKR